MKDSKVYGLPNRVTPNQPVLIDADGCIGCNLCVEACPNDVMMPNPEKKEAPIILYPEECWYCACCVMDCPLQDKHVIEINWPLMQRVRWKRKQSGDHYRIGMPNPPAPNTKPPV